MNTYFLIESSGTNVITLKGRSLQTTTFVQRNVFDLRLGSMVTEKFPSMPRNKICAFNREDKTVKVVTDLDPIIIRKIAKCELLADGYGYLNWFANQMFEQYSTTESLSFQDLAVYQLDPSSFIQTFASSKNLSIAEAEKQIAFDISTIQTVAIRRKQILWSNTPALLKVTSPDELDTWKESVLSDVVGGI